MNVGISPNPLVQKTQDDWKLLKELDWTASHSVGAGSPTVHRAAFGDW